MPVYVVDKPLHSTSHDIVAQARRLLGTRRVGHGGTLDPLAGGVLVLLTEDETKLSPFLTGSVKSYLAWVSFGATTPTLDAEGPLLTEPDANRSPVDLEGPSIEAVLPPFLELTEQVPPAFSAVKRGGVKGYEAARAGTSLDLPPRPAGYRRIELLAFAPERDALPRTFAPDAHGWFPSGKGRELPLPDPLGRFPTALLRLEVEAGTYIRAFARDLGAALGTGAFLSGLIRTSAGRLELSRAVPPDALPTAEAIPPATALPFPVLTLTEEQAARVRLGQRLPLRLAERSTLIGPRGELVAIAEERDGRMKLLRVWGGA